MLSIFSYVCCHLYVFFGEMAVYQGPQLDLFATDAGDDDAGGRIDSPPGAQSEDNSGMSPLTPDDDARQVLEELRHLDLDTVSPRQAIEMLYQWRQLLEKPLP